MLIAPSLQIEMQKWPWRDASGGVHEGACATAQRRAMGDSENISKKGWNFVDKRMVMTDICISWLDDHLDSGAGLLGLRRMKPSRPRGLGFFFFSLVFEYGARALLGALLSSGIRDRCLATTV